MWPISEDHPMPLKFNVDFGILSSKLQTPNYQLKVPSTKVKSRYKTITGLCRLIGNSRCGRISNTKPTNNICK